MKFKYKVETIEISSIDEFDNLSDDKSPEIIGLTSSIKRFGLLKPIEVERWNGKYFIVDGKKRVEAFRRLRKEKIRAYIKQ